MATVDDCYVHGKRWRYEFQYMLNQLRSKVIPTQYLTQLPGLVCGCQRQPDKYRKFWQSVSDTVLQSSFNDFKTRIKECQDEAITTVLKNAGYRVNKTLGPDFSNQMFNSLTQLQLSMLKLLYIIQKAVIQDLSPFLSTLMTKSVPDKETVPPMAQTFDLTAGNFDKIHLVFGPGGFDIKQFAKRNKCSVSVSKKGINGVAVTITKKNNPKTETMLQIKDKFVEHVESMFASYKAMGEMLREGRLNRLRSLPTPTYLKDEVLQATDDFSIKEEREEDFKKKSSNHHSDRKVKGRNVLESGHCLHCMKPYTSLADNSVCKHHDGYLKDSRWTCCGERCIDITDYEMMHEETGCVESPVHNWRVDKKCDPKLSKPTSKKAETVIPKLGAGCSTDEALKRLNDMT